MAEPIEESPPFPGQTSPHRFVARPGAPDICLCSHRRPSAIHYPSLVPGPGNLFPQAYGTFVDGGGKVITARGSFYPAHLQVQLDRRRALEVIQTLASQLLYPDEQLTVQFSGTYLDQQGEE